MTEQRGGQEEDGRGVRLQEEGRSGAFAVPTCQRGVAAAGSCDREEACPSIITDINHSKSSALISLQNWLS